MKKGTGWFIADCIFGLIGGICGIGSIITGIKSAQIKQELDDARIEEKYGLTPVDTEE